ncbi:MAG: LysM peptidoglycan-binding domain-containing protein [Bacteroidales bacterium]|nr:LysM peptidoglycan-binding domain-containing protein [Bacteroidales bacterium]
MKKILLISLFFTPLISLTAQNTVRGTRQQLIREILSLRQEVTDLKTLLDQSIVLSDTITANDTLNYGNLFLDYTEKEELLADISTDSLLSLFYLQRSLHHNSHNDFYNLDIDNLNVVADLPDSVYISRLKALNSVITLPYNSTVRNSIVFYTQRMMPDRIPTILGLATYYMPIFEEIFDQHDMPLELKVMAIIESALNPVAVSRARARGMWQFMHQTGLQYGLTINSYVDERYDPIVSGHAAAKYLKDAYTVYGDWALAISSYNCGMGNVNRAIRRAGSREFWDIYPFLPRETRGYVPAFVAALYTLNYYKEHGIKPRRIEMPAHLDTFHISQRLHFEQIAEFTGISVSELRDLNPQYIRDVIPGKPYILRLPHQYTSLFIDHEQEIYAFKADTYFNPILLAQSRPATTTSSNQIIHTVRSGETLGGIALRYRVTTSDIQYWNNLRGTLIRVGQRLSIYPRQAPAAASTSTSTAASTSAAARTTTATATGNASANNQSATYQWHTIQRGESLWLIAQNYNVSLNDLMELNGLNRNSRILAGNRLRIRRL